MCLSLGRVIAHLAALHMCLLLPYLYTQFDSLPQKIGQAQKGSDITEALDCNFDYAHRLGGFSSQSEVL